MSEKALYLLTDLVASSDGAAEDGYDYGVLTFTAGGLQRMLRTLTTLRRLYELDDTGVYRCDGKLLAGFCVVRERALNSPALIDAGNRAQAGKYTHINREQEMLLWRHRRNIKGLRACYVALGPRLKFGADIKHSNTNVYTHAFEESELQVFLKELEADGERT